MLGKVSLEEAFELPETMESAKGYAELYIAPNDTARYLRQVASITDERLEVSDKHGIGYTILSLTSPGVQGMSNKDEAEKFATRANDYAHEKIQGHRDRLGAFAALSMHDPAQAARELRRCVTEYGFHGALLNDVQHAGEDGETYLFYDQPQYDQFWAVAQELDVPIYIHPAPPIGKAYQKLYADRRYLVGPPLSFANGVGVHTMGLIINGVFDRFPKLKVIIGHLGERLPFDFTRAHHWIEHVEKPLAHSRGHNICKQDYYHYWKNNIWLTTSGHFSTETLAYVSQYVGPSRIMFSVDYPYETIPKGCGWWDGDAENIKKALGGEQGYKDVGRENAKKLLKLGPYFQSEA